MHLINRDRLLVPISRGPAFDPFVVAPDVLIQFANNRGIVRWRFKTGAIRVRLQVRIAITRADFKGHDVVNVRVFYDAGEGELKPDCWTV